MANFLPAVNTLLWLQNIELIVAAKGVEEITTVELKEIIRKEYFLKRKFIRQIASQLHHTRKTVRKALNDPGVPVHTRKKPQIKQSIGPFACPLVGPYCISAHTQ